MDMKLLELIEKSRKELDDNQTATTHNNSAFLELVNYARQILK
jgi:hypothetical protein